MLRELLEKLEYKRDLTYLTSHWPTLFGAEVHAALKHHKLLKDAGVGKYLPCSMDGGQVCCKDVVANPLPKPKHPYFSICGRESSECEAREVPAAELAAEAFSYSGFAVLLQRLLGIVVELAEPCPPLPETYRLGRRSWGGAQREILLTYSGGREAFPFFLTGLQASGQPTLVLVPSLTPRMRVLLASHGTGATVEVRALSDLLVLDDGRLQLKSEYLLKDTRKHVEAPPVIDAYCAVVDCGHERLVDRAEYDRLAVSPDYALVVDLKTGLKARVRRRDERGVVESELPPAEAKVAAKLMSSWPRDICLGHELREIGNTRQALIRARKVIDPKGCKTYPWVLKVGEESEELARFEFKPPPKVKWLLFRPLPKVA
jgi:hypothetical protein